MPRSFKECYFFLTGIIGIFISISSFITFFILNNYHAAVWAIISGFSSSILILINILKFRYVLHEWYSLNGIKGFEIFGVVLSTVSFASFIWYIFINFYYSIPLLPIRTSRIIPSVFSLISLKQALHLTRNSIHYQNTYDNLNNISSDEDEQD